MKAICTTTIDPVTIAYKKFVDIAERDNWTFYIAGDRKTPEKEYQKLAYEHDCVVYLSIKEQEQISKELSSLIGYDCIQRRNFALIAAYRDGADIIASVDSDNIPYPKWGQNVIVNQNVYINTYNEAGPVFDPLSPVFPHLWHRGFPIQLLDGRHISAPKRIKRKVLVQADFWDGAPDVDAVCRITLNPNVKFDATMSPFASNKISPFNSQNTFLSRDLFPTYFLFPHIGRMDDIWASYITQHKFPNSVIYSKASVWQNRNPHDLVKDLQAEMLGYQHSLEIATNKMDAVGMYTPLNTMQAYEVYKALFK